MVRKLLHQYKNDANAIRTSWLKKDWLFISLLIFFSIYCLLVFCFSREPFNYIYNSLLIIIAALTFVFCISRGSLNIDSVSVFLIIFTAITTTINVFKGVFLLNPIVNPLVILVFYQFSSSCSKNERMLLIRSVYLSLIVLLVWATYRYLPVWLKSKNPYDFDSYFENLDGLTNYFAILFAISLFYISKGQFQSTLISVFSLFFILISERRAALLLIAVSLLIFFYRIFGWKHKAAFAIFILSGIVIAGFLFMAIPQLSAIAERFLYAIESIFSYEGAYSGEERLNIIIRGLVYTFSSFSGALGADQIVYFYGGQPPHDILGDFAFNYGGFLSIIFTFCFALGALKLIKSSNQISKTIGWFFFVIFFLATLLSNRNYCLIMGLFLGFCGDGRNQHFHRMIDKVTMTV